MCHFKGTAWCPLGTSTFFAFEFTSVLLDLHISAFLKVSLRALIRPASGSLNPAVFKRNGQSPVQCAALPFLTIMRVTPFFKSLRAIADCLSNFSSMPPRRYQIHQHTNSNGNRDYPISDRPTFHSINPLFAFRSSRHQCPCCQGA